MALPENFVSRSDLGWGNTAASYANISQGLVIHYDSGNLGLANKPHSACVQYWHNTRAFHRGPQRGWADIGYSFFSCPHDYILEGRGLNRQQAAQPGGNATHYSVTLATGPAEEIPDAQINSVRRLRKWLIEDHDNHPRVLGHRDFISTSCPGDKAYALVTNGTFAQPPGAITEGADLLGLKEGDGIPNPSEGVKAVQRLIVAAGFGEHLEPYGVDGQWGAGTSAGLLAARHYVGSGVSSINRMTGESYAQLIRACARREAERAVKNLDIPSGGGEGGLPTQFDATIKVK